MRLCDIFEATHVEDKLGKVHRIAEKWGVDAENHLPPPSKGGFGCVTESGERISMWDARNYYAEDLNEEAPPQVRELELYAFIGRDEYGSGEFGLKQGVVPAGTIPMVAIDQARLDQYWQDAEAQAEIYGQRIYLVKLKAVEVVRGTKHGK